MLDGIWLFVIILILGFFLRMMWRGLPSNFLKTLLRIIAFIGIIIHELCHYGMCLLMGKRPESIKVSYREMKGSVRSDVGTFLQAFLIGLAPLLIMSYIAWFCLDIALFSSFLWYYRWLAGILVISILFAAGPSPADIRAITSRFSRNSKYAMFQILIVFLSGIIVYFLTSNLFIPVKFSFIYFIFIGVGYFFLKYLAMGVNLLAHLLTGNGGHRIPSRHGFRGSISTLKLKKKRKIGKIPATRDGVIDHISNDDTMIPQQQYGEDNPIDNIIGTIIKRGKRKRIKIEYGQW